MHIAGWKRLETHNLVNKSPNLVFKQKKLIRGLVTLKAFERKMSIVFELFDLCSKHKKVWF